jgi:hypothetical protein
MAKTVMRFHSKLSSPIVCMLQAASRSAKPCHGKPPGCAAPVTGRPSRFSRGRSDRSESEPSMCGLTDQMKSALSAIYTRNPTKEQIEQTVNTLLRHGVGVGG